MTRNHLDRANTTKVPQDYQTDDKVEGPPEPQYGLNERNII